MSITHDDFVAPLHDDEAVCLFWSLEFLQEMEVLDIGVDERLKSIGGDLVQHGNNSVLDLGDRLASDTDVNNVTVISWGVCWQGLVVVEELNSSVVHGGKPRRC